MNSVVKMTSNISAIQQAVDMATELLEARVFLSCDSHMWPLAHHAQNRHRNAPAIHLAGRKKQTITKAVQATSSNELFADFPAIRYRLANTSPHVTPAVASSGLLAGKYRVGTSNVTPSGSSAPGGYTPTQMRNAYGFNNITFGAVTGDGTGQTIVIVDAYRNPNIAADLAAFNAQFGIPAPPSFQIMSQTGGSVSTVPLDPAGAGHSAWGLETALDVQWAHAMAPKANIILIESNSDNYDDIVGSTSGGGAVNYARTIPGVSAISMSWGGTEDLDELALDQYFTTPVGHTPIGFFAASGDSGVNSQYPAFSPNVVAVGGTSLTVDGAGNYISETGWNNSGGGISGGGLEDGYELLPAFQKGYVTQSTVNRTVPDISFAGNPSLGGVPVYDSYNNGTTTPWVTVGGTSLGTPMWAALASVIDQGRALAGRPNVGSTDTLLPRLYQYSTGVDAATLFHDITVGNNGVAAGPGYDLVTGIGTPIANNLVNKLVNSGAFVRPSLQYGPTTSTVSSIDFKFNESMNTGAFSIAGNIDSFTGPGGANLSGALTGFTWINSQTLRVNFTTRTTDGQYALTLKQNVPTAAGSTLDQNGNGVAGEATDAFTANFQIVSSVVKRAIYYNQSSFDGNNAAADPVADAGAIATNKEALLPQTRTILIPGNTSSTANITSYDKGINGIIIDVVNLPGTTLAPSDFTFKAGTSATVSSWTDVTATPLVDVFPGAGLNGSSRVIVRFPIASVRNTWLQVTMKANVNTGLAAPDVFYFGNLVGDTMNTPAGAAIVTGSDQLNVRSQIAATNGQPVAITSTTDFSRDGRVLSGDLLTARFWTGSGITLPVLIV